MNGWDFFTYLMCVVLAVSVVFIFAFFVRDAKDIIRGEAPPEDEEDGWE